MTAGSGPPASPAALVGTTLGASYKLEKLLGQGRHGALYDARHPRLGRHYMVRVLGLDGNRRAALAGAMSQYAVISHPNLVPPHDVLTTQAEQLAICVPLLPGLNLSDRVASQGKLTVAEGTEMLRQASSALHALHKQGLVHGNLSAANLFFTFHDHVAVDNALGSSKGGQTVQLLDAGLHLVDMQPGQPPVTAADDQKVLGKLALANVSDLSQGQQRVLERTQEARPEARYPTMLEMWQAFDSAQAPGRKQQPGSVSTALVPQIRLPKGAARAAGGISRRNLVLIAAAVAGLTMIGLFAFLAGGRSAGPVAVATSPELGMPSEIHIAFEITPPSATVSAGGKSAPASVGLTLPRGDRPVEIVLSAEGYQTKTMSVIPSGARTIALTLSKSGAAPGESAGSANSGDGDDDGDGRDKKHKRRERRHHRSAKEKLDGGGESSRREKLPAGLKGI